jgi:formate dehydrogenase subunit gamma
MTTHRSSGRALRLAAVLALLATTWGGTLAMAQAPAPAAPPPPVKQESMPPVSNLQVTTPLVPNIPAGPSAVEMNATARPASGLMSAPNEAEMLRALRSGELRGQVTIPDRKLAVLMQPEGRDWRATMQGPVRVIGSWLILGMLAVLIAFYLLRGRIQIDGGFSGRTIQRFNAFERFTHWLTASSFVVLALSGLNVTFGRYLLLPLLGPDLFTTLSLGAKYAHNFLAFPFMLGLVLMFVIWVGNNIPNRYDFEWIAAGGGLFRRGVHPPSRKFNAGQKLIFWSVVVFGGILSVTGIYMLFPFYFGDVHTQQLMTVLHSIFALIIVAIIVAHIYIGTIGMEGAWDAMGTGQVDERWAREHHNVWVAEVKGEPLPKYGHD